LIRQNSAKDKKISLGEIALEARPISAHICPLNLQVKKIRRNLKLRNPEDSNSNQIKIHLEQTKIYFGVTFYQYWSRSIPRSATAQGFSPTIMKPEILNMQSKLNIFFP
jgi:hypothetical protein